MTGEELRVTQTALSDDMARARAALQTDSALGVVAVKGGETLTGAGRGVKPLLTWLADGTRLDGFAAADRVVGKGAALLYVKLGAAAVWAETMSETGLATLQAHGIEVGCGDFVPRILNRDRTGMCPIEQSVAAIDTPDEAEPAIRAAVARLMAAR